jgi:hypothetical protein
MKKYLLKHKNIDVAIIDIDPDLYYFRKIKLLNPGHFPYGVKAETPAFDEWWKSRIISISRKDVKRFIDENRLSGVSEFALKSFGLNLTDHYWLAPKEEKALKWEDVNFFDNSFKNNEAMMFDLNARTPDSSTGGQLSKRWMLESGTRYLLKDGVKPVFTEAYNEKIGSRIGIMLGINCVDYDVVIKDGVPASKCACFIDRNTELVTAYQIMEARAFPPGKNKYEHCVECFQEFGGMNARRRIDEMIVFDYLLANTDRHAWNFGAIRDAESLQPLSFAPLFDHERSMWETGAGQDCRTFCETHDEQIKLVKDLSWYEPEMLKNAGEEVYQIMAGNPYRNFENSDQPQKELDALLDRIEKLNQIAFRQNSAGKVYL